MAIATLTSNESGANSLIDINANFADLDTTKADLASPTFTGTPVLPTGTTGVTQSASDNSTKLATTAYVDTNGILSTSGVSGGPASSSTQTITHGLGKIPKIIRLHGYGRDASGSKSGSSSGTYNSTGNRCVYVQSGGGVNPATSTSYAIYMSYFSSTERNATGVVGNVGATTFDIVWTNSNDVSTFTSFMWEAQ